MIEIEVLGGTTVTVSVENSGGVVMEVGGIPSADITLPNYGLITWNGSYLTVS